MIASTLLGPLSATCNSGYSLAVDKKTCQVTACTFVRIHLVDYNCKCNQDFKVDDADSKKCIHIDECLAWTFNCTDVSQLCKNTYGSYKCVAMKDCTGLTKSAKKAVFSLTGLDKGEAPPPPPAAPPPRPPSDEEKSQSVNLEIQGLNISQWNEPLQEKFKTTLAEKINAV
ncbi:hypothetical protein OS493_007415 [Desmophyllum pertusum]|uniref:NOTCH1 EGF-like calcium-binding domain-containing protein n=1 Tax=Desmophyllum pertusum TaxID=174260 RepID=A0A9W9Z388_9CNID|nr:hypothetical protein OS493_007415 [Desmophyllum pertusum]